MKLQGLPSNGYPKKVLSSHGAPIKVLAAADRSASPKSLSFSLARSPASPREQVPQRSPRARRRGEFPAPTSGYPPFPAVTAASAPFVETCSSVGEPPSAVVAAKGSVKERCPTSSRARPDGVEDKLDRLRRELAQASSSPSPKRREDESKKMIEGCKQQDLNVLTESSVLQDVEAGSLLSDVTQLLYRHKGLTSLQLPGTVAFGELVSLRVLSLSHNALCDIGPIADLPTLVDLNVNHNKIKDLSPAFQCENLEVLFAANNCISSIAGLELQHLRHLSLFRNGLSDLPAVVQTLAGLPELRKLDLGGNPCAQDPSQNYGIVRTLAQLTQIDGESVGNVDRALANEFFTCARDLGFSEASCSAALRPKTAPAIAASNKRQQRRPSPSPSRSPSVRRSGSRSRSTSRRRPLRPCELPGEASSQDQLVVGMRQQISDIESTRLQIQTVQVDCENLRRQIADLRSREPTMGLASLRDRRQELEEENKFMHDCAMKNQQLKTILTQKESELSAKRAAKGLSVDSLQRPRTSRPRSAAGLASAAGAAEAVLELSERMQSGSSSKPQMETVADLKFRNHLLRRELDRAKQRVSQLSTESCTALLSSGLNNESFELARRRPGTAMPESASGPGVTDHKQRFDDLNGLLNWNEQSLRQITGLMRRTECAMGLQRPMTTGHLQQQQQSDARRMSDINGIR